MEARLFQRPKLICLRVISNRIGRLVARSQLDQAKAIEGLWTTEVAEEEEVIEEVEVEAGEVIRDRTPMLLLNLL